MENLNLKAGAAFKWTVLYFGVMLFYTFINVAVWRKVIPEYADWLHLITAGACILMFIRLLITKGGFYFQPLSDNLWPGILLAVSCSVLFYFLLDCGLDPLTENLFPASEQNYREMIQTLLKSPVTSLLQVCILAPLIEEVLMRGFILEGLKKSRGTLAALLISSVLFALLHFNMVQTLSAFVCGLILGLLYLKTNSLLCCIIAHCGYNLISYFVMIRPFTG